MTLCGKQKESKQLSLKFLARFLNHIHIVRFKRSQSISISIDPQNIHKFA